MYTKSHVSLVIIIKTTKRNKKKKRTKKQSSRYGRGIDDNSKIFFPYFSTKIYVVTPSLEPSHRDGSNDGSHNMFLWRNMANYP